MKLLNNKMLSEEDKIVFDKEKTEYNFKTGIMSIRIIFFFETLVLLYSLIIARDFTKTGLMYIALYSFLFLLSLFLLIFVNKLKKLKNTYWFMLLYCSLILSWAACISFLDITNSYMHSFVYLTLVMVVSGSLIIYPKSSFILHSVFFTLYYIFGTIVGARGLDIGFFINLIVFTVFAFLISYNKYKISIQCFVKQKTILQNVQKLKEMYETQQKLNEKLRIASCTDALTGVNNRWKLHNTFDKLLYDCFKNKKNLCVMMFDLDDFKGINDRYGHNAGDESLIRIAAIFKKNVDLNCIFRYGGEEFIVILSGKTNEEAYAVAEKIRKDIESENSGEIKLTISGGVFIKIPDEKSDSDEYLIGSDKALYEAKTNNKNKIIMIS